MASDIDLVVLTDDVEPFVAATDWIRTATGQHGLIVEFSFAPASWASTDPLDTGTAQVVAEGFGILYDPGEMLRGLVTAVQQLQA